MGEQAVTAEEILLDIKVADFGVIILTPVLDKAERHFDKWWPKAGAAG